jgi:asparagine synthase (glutamine-hydrolysing)
MIKRYESADGRLASTSWLACADAQPRLDPDPVGALDYLFHGANHGNRTACEQVRIADPAEVRELVGGLRERRFGPAYWAPGALLDDREQALERVQARLVQLARGWADGFPDRLRSALSGGYDSRLLLAAAWATGQRPALHVYGHPDSADARTAAAVDRALGLGLRLIDKDALDRAHGGQPDLDANLDFFDGLPIDGILDRGADRATRIAQSAGGALALNGGGGEVLRDFFHLRQAGMRARDLVRVFWGGIDPAALRRPGLLAALDEHLATTIETELGHGGRLSRQEIELVYPLLRGRYWTSRNNSMAARSGHFLTPLLDPQIVRDAARLPLAWKRFGRFEGALIARLAPELGALPLADGHTPARGPALPSRIATTLLDSRPPWLRQASARLRAQRIAQRSPPRCDDDEFPRMALLVEPARLRAPALRARLITLERLLARQPAP